MDQLRGAGQDYSYDGFDRTATATSLATCGSTGVASYTYDGLGRQATHTANTTTTTITYDGLTSAVAAEAGTATTSTYQLAPDGTPQAVTDGLATDTQYLTTDGDNNIATTENTTGALACATRYDPFGTNLDPSAITTTGTVVCSTGTSIDDIGYQTNRKDPATGNYQDGTRTYDPTNAAFTTPDQYTSGNTNQNTSIKVDPLTQDTYTYVNGNPLNFTDPTGHMPCDQYACGSVKALVAQENQIQANEAQQQKIQAINSQVNSVYSLATQVAGDQGISFPNPLSAITTLDNTFAPYMQCLYGNGFGDGRSQTNAAERSCIGQGGLGEARLAIQDYLNAGSSNYGILTNLGAVGNYITQSGLNLTLPVKSSTQYEGYESALVGGLTLAVVSADAGQSASDISDILAGPAAETAGAATGYPISEAGEPLAGGRNAGISRAWALEQELVEVTGQGTVDWNDEQLAELLAEGDVTGFVGHHINNVADYPEWQGDPRNIRFLSAYDHLYSELGHAGSWSNSTTGDLIDRQAMIDNYLNSNDSMGDVDAGSGD